MRHPVSRDLFAYWDALRAGRTAPERSAIDPAAIRHLLAYTFLLEVGESASDSKEVSFRLSGTRLNALFHRDLKGEVFAGIWEGRDRIETVDLVDGVLDDRTPVVAAVLGAPADHEPCAFELLLLPLRHHGRTRARLLGSLAPPSVPSWIGLRPVEALHLSSFRTVLPCDRGRLGVFGVAARNGAVPVAAARAEPAPGPIAAGRPVPLTLHMGGRAGVGATTLGRLADPG